MVKPFQLLLLGLLLAMFLLGGCSQQEKAEEVTVAEPAPAKQRQGLQIVVPETVKGKWRSVKIAVRDQETNAEEVYTVDIGGSFQVPESSLRVKVDTFLPAFIMDGKQMTSASNETSNPAARITVTEAGTEVFSGWLFGLYPDTHAFQHPRYSFSLLEYTPTN